MMRMHVRMMRVHVGGVEQVSVVTLGPAGLRVAVEIPANHNEPCSSLNVRNTTSSPALLDDS
jgi:hypothetical protein